MSELIGVPTKLAVRVERKQSDNDYGSYGVVAEMEVNLREGEDLHEAFDVLDRWLTVKVGASMKEKGEKIAKRNAPPVAPEAPVAPPMPVAQPVQQPQPAQHAGMLENLDREDLNEFTLSHAVTQNGQDYILVKGGKWSKYGVKAWPEVADTISDGWKQWPIGQEYNQPAHIRCAVVELKPDGNPKKVVAFES